MAQSRTYVLTCAVEVTASGVIDSCVDVPERVRRFDNRWMLAEWAGEDLFYVAEHVIDDLVGTSGAPALLGQVVLSNYVHLFAGAPGQDLWQACLARAAARDATGAEEFDAQFAPPAEAAANMVRWADTAGLRPPAHEALEALFSLDEPDPFADDLVDALIKLLFGRAERT